MKIELIGLLSIFILGSLLIIKGYHSLNFLKQYQSYPLVKISFSDIEIAKTAGTGIYYSENPMYYIKGIFNYKSNHLNIIQYDSGFDASFYRFFNQENAKLAIDKWKENGCMAYINNNRLILDIPINIKYKSQHFITLILSGILLNITAFIIYLIYQGFSL